MVCVSLRVIKGYPDRQILQYQYSLTTRAVSSNNVWHASIWTEGFDNEKLVKLTKLARVYTQGKRNKENLSGTKLALCVSLQANENLHTQNLA